MAGVAHACSTRTPVAAGQGRLLSGFGMRTGRTTGRPTFHAGIDVGGPRGSVVYAPRPGVVEAVARDQDRGGGFRGYGNAVVLHHPGEGLWTLYAHLDRVAVGAGQEVGAGEPLGAIGATTNGRFPGMGAHLHLELRRARPDGSSPFPGRYGAYNVDPRAWLAGHGVTFSGSGIVADGSRAACASEPASVVAPTVALRGPRPIRMLAGLGLGEDDPNAGYEPPVPESFEKEKWFPKFILGGLIVVGVAGIGLALAGKTA